MIHLANENNIKVLVGYIHVSSYHHIIKNTEYELEFEHFYERLKADFGVILFPFLFKEFIDIKAHTYDGFHPTGVGHKVLAQVIKNTLDPLLER